MTAEDSQQSDSPQLSLSDLDALIEEDSEDEDMVAAIGDQALDVLVLSAFLALALVSFFKKSTLLKYTTMIVSVVYIGFFKSSLVSIVNIFGLLSGTSPFLDTTFPGIS